MFVINMLSVRHHNKSYYDFENNNKQSKTKKAAETWEESVEAI